MPLVDFTEWATPDLELPWGGHVYRVSPPSVDDYAKILAAAVRSEIKLGIVKPEAVPDGALAALDRIAPDEQFALRDAYPLMVANGVPKETIDRMSFYAVFYWARNEAYADWIASVLWGRQTPAEPDARPKGRRSSPPRTTRRGGSASPTQTDGSPTTDRSRTS